MSAIRPKVGRVLVVGDVMTDIICKPAGPLVPGADRRAVIPALLRSWACDGRGCGLASRRAISRYPA